jgi:hypothetical protein
MAATRRHDRTLIAGLITSAVLHFLAVAVIDNFNRESAEAEVFRSRLAIQSRFEPRRLVTARPHELKPRELRYLPSRAEQVAPPKRDMSSHPLPQAPAPDAPATSLEKRELASRSAAPVLTRERMPASAEFGWSDTIGMSEPFELLRMEDLARSGRERAAVVFGELSRRDLTGFLSITRLRVYGAGSAATAAVDALARYMRDNTKMLVRIRQGISDYFLSEELLKDPIHFLFEGGGQFAYDADKRTYFSDTERDLLRRYLEEGGFLFIEGSYRFLGDMADQLRETLGPEAHLIPVPFSHDIYHSYYEFDAGFPSEDAAVKERFLRLEEVAPSNWDYPGKRKVDQAELSIEEQLVQPSQNQPEQVPTVGLWAVELRGELVAVISDLAMFEHWSSSFDTEEGDDLNASQSAGSELFLMAGTNVVVYALTRSRGLTTKRAAPAWRQVRPAVSLQEDAGDGRQLLRPEEPAYESVERLVEQFDGVDLDASLAILQSPLGTSLRRRGLQAIVEGGYSVSLMRSDLSGVILHNLPAGKLWLELRQSGQSEQLEVELVAGNVATVTFGQSRVAFFSSMRMGQLEEQVDVESWFRSFPDLTIEEIFLSEDERERVRSLSK